MYVQPGHSGMKMSWQLTMYVKAPLIMSIGLTIKAGSQRDARPCVALIRETHKFITKKSRGFLTTRRTNVTQGNARIGSESILALCCVSTSVDVKTTQRNALFSVIL